ncbi:MAG TPA: phospholipase D-like domain-containing protein [Vicinamibacterales bacterium]|nr:phospholipase D-like domain-containing protein [Vicinamibacterales bacterium]
MAVVSYLIAPVETQPAYGLDHDLTVDSDEFLTTITGATGAPFVAGNSLEILNNGDEFYPSMLAAIRSAQVSITIEAYIFWDGEIGLEFAEALAERARSGVRVKILLDAVGSSDIGDDIVKKLEAASCQIAWYNPLRWYTLGRFNNRTHRKSLIIDGRVAFTGGAGIADKWRGQAQDADHWRDIQIRLEGPGVTPLQTGFAQNWLETTRELVSGPMYYPVLESAGPLSAMTIISSPVTGSSTARTMYYLSIASARRAVYIANPYFVPDPAALDTLIEAKKRGVNVRIMVAGDENENWLSRHNAVRLYGRLLEAGIDIMEYDRTLLHHKTMVVDGVWSTIGTTNFDSRSFAHNEENNVCFYDRDVAKQLDDIFENDVQHCTKIELESWQRRGLWRKLQEFVAAFLQEQV